MKVLIVDDDHDLLQELGYSLDDLGHQSQSCLSGEQALSLLKTQAAEFGLVLSDVRMPGMSGLELLQRCRGLKDMPPVAIMSGHADMDMTIQALRLRAMDFLVKPFGVAALRELVQRAHALAHSQPDFARSRLPIERERWSMEMRTQTSAVPAICAQIMSVLQARLPSVERDSVRLALAEALNNAMVHGNLALGSELKEAGDWEGFEAELERRQQDPAYGERKIFVEVDAGLDGLTIAIEDQGKGFDPASLPDPTDPAALLNNSGRGVMLMRFAMDEVRWNARGNRVEMRKQLPQ